jgi:hypothetical protein
MLPEAEADNGLPYVPAVPEGFVANHPTSSPSKRLPGAAELRR